MIQISKNDIKNNDIKDIDLTNDFVLVNKMIPTAPMLPLNGYLYNQYNLNINVKTRFNDFGCYKRYLKNKRKRQHKKTRKLENYNTN